MGPERHPQWLLQFSNDRTAIIDFNPEIEIPFSAIVSTQQGHDHIEIDGASLFLDAAAGIIDFFDAGRALVDRRESLMVRRILDLAMSDQARGAFVSLCAADGEARPVPAPHWNREFVAKHASVEAMNQVNEISDTARSAQPNTQLADATISMGGFPAALRDTRDYYEHDIRFIIVVTLVVVLLILMALLRAIVAPLYLVGSVVISYFAALGISVLTFQYLLGQQLHWSVPPLAFVVLVAVGADYNLLFVSRMRDESPHGMRYGVIRTLTSTGGVITAAGLIFAASMCGLMFSSITTVVQGGFVIGVGVLLDTFLVRTVTVPAMATLVGRANWWPSRLSGQRSPVEHA
jgi:transport protein